MSPTYEHEGKEERDSPQDYEYDQPKGYPMEGVLETGVENPPVEEEKAGFSARQGDGLKKLEGECDLAIVSIGESTSQWPPLYLLTNLNPRIHEIQRINSWRRNGRFIAQRAALPCYSLLGRGRDRVSEAERRTPYRHATQDQVHGLLNS